MSGDSADAPTASPRRALDPAAVLTSVDGEIAFNRKRAGQVFFFGLLVEGLILAGDKTIPSPQTWTWQRAYLVMFFFFAVAAVGITLGAEYRRRIHFMKRRRLGLLAEYGYPGVFPERGDQVISEIQVLYVVLVFLSTAGSFTTWLTLLPANAVLCQASFAASWIGWAFGLFWIVRCLRGSKRTGV